MKSRKIKEVCQDATEAKILGMDIKKFEKEQNKAKVFGVKKEDIFTLKTLWKVTTPQNSELLYTGFEVAQMMSLSAKEKIKGGCRELMDNGFKFSFVRNIEARVKK